MEGWKYVFNYLDDRDAGKKEQVLFNLHNLQRFPKFTRWFTYFTYLEIDDAKNVHQQCCYNFTASIISIQLSSILLCESALIHEDYKSTSQIVGFCYPVPTISLAPFKNVTQTHYDVSTRCGLHAHTRTFRCSPY